MSWGKCCGSIVQRNHLVQIRALQKAQHTLSREICCASTNNTIINYLQNAQDLKRCIALVNKAQEENTLCFCLSLSLLTHSCSFFLSLVLSPFLPLLLNLFLSLSLYNPSLNIMPFITAALILYTAESLVLVISVTILAASKLRCYWSEWGLASLSARLISKLCFPKVKDHSSLAWPGSAGATRLWKECVSSSRGLRDAASWAASWHQSWRIGRRHLDWSVSNSDSATGDTFRRRGKVDADRLHWFVSLCLCSMYWVSTSLLTLRITILPWERSRRRNGFVYREQP